jgi:hypothetical protein
MKVTSLSELSTRPQYSPGNIPGTHFSYRLSRNQGYITTRSIMSMKNTNDVFGNRTRNLPACIYEIYVAQYAYGL